MTAAAAAACSTYINTYNNTKTLKNPSLPLKAYIYRRQDSLFSAPPQTHFLFDESRAPFLGHRNAQRKTRGRTSCCYHSSRLHVYTTIRYPGPPGPIPRELVCSKTTKVPTNAFPEEKRTRGTKEALPYKVPAALCRCRPVPQEGLFSSNRALNISFRGMTKYKIPSQPRRKVHVYL